MIANAIDANYWKGADKHGQRTLVKIGNIAKTKHDSHWGRVYDPSGISATLHAEGGGFGAKTGLYLVPKIIADRSRHYRGDGRNFEGAKDYSNAISTVQKDNLLLYYDYVLKNFRIRKLMPVECERLQGFPDFWTAKISDTQRYKCIGNAVTTNVITFLGTKLGEMLKAREKLI